MPAIKRSVNLRSLADAIAEGVYTSGRYPVVHDLSGQAALFLKYRGRYLSALKRGDTDPESLRRGLTQCLHSGSWMILDGDKMEVDWAAMLEPSTFPEAVFSPGELFLEDTFRPLLRESDEFAAKVTYEHSAALAQGAFQDRTKAYAPERVADVNSNFEPKEPFRLVVVVKNEVVPDFLQEKMEIFEIDAGGAKGSDGLWAGGERPKEKRSKELQAMDKELVELAFEGDLAGMKELLDKGADSRARDSRGNEPLSEAACNGHMEVVKFLLAHKTPLGADPNAVNTTDGRTALHRASFQGHHEIVQVLLEHAADPRLKDVVGREIAFDMASNPETIAVFDKWDIAKTETLLEQRAKAVEAEEEKLIKTDEERKRYERRKLIEKLIKFVLDGDKDSLDVECAGLEQPVDAYRDDRGNTLLMLAAWHEKKEICGMLIDEHKAVVNARESKGWTALQIAAFHGHKMIVQLLCSKGADLDLKNGYHKTAFDLAKDDEIKSALEQADAGALVAPPAPAPTTADDAEAKPKAKAKAKGKAKAEAKASKAPAKAAGATAAAKPAAKRATSKGKAKAKAK